MDIDPEEAQLLSLTGNCVASGCTADQVELYFNGGEAGLVLRRRINDTIPQAQGTLLMLIASRPDGSDDDESIRVAETLKRYGARIDQPDSVIGSTPLVVAADFGKPRFLQWLVDQGARIDHRNRISPTLPIYLSCQNNHPQCVGILAKAAIEQGKVHTLNTKSKFGNSPGYNTMERGFVECMGALAMGGADLRQVFAMYWVPPGHDSETNAPTTDPDPSIQPNWSLFQTLLSFTTLQCASCQTISTNLNCCSRCHMAHYCSRNCQKQNWKLHKHCCKKLRAGQDMVHGGDNRALPVPSNETFGFVLPFEGDDFHSERDEDPDRPIWEYNAGSRGIEDWRRYPIRIEESIESLLQLGSPRYMYRPGNTEAEGMYEQRRSRAAPPNVATNYLYYCDMLERDFYSGSIRGVRRNGSREPPSGGDWMG